MTVPLDVNSITAEEFLAAFASAWAEHQKQIVPDELHRRYMQDREWTNEMLHEESGVLCRTRRLITRPGETPRYRREWYTIDALFIGGEELLEGRTGYPSRLDVLVEHENGDRWEEEMWKLLFWRSPLKVLIGYDYYEEDKTEPDRRTGCSRRTWLDEKISKLRTMLQKASESDQSSVMGQFLLVVGNRQSRDPDSAIRWRWARLDGEGDPMPFA